MITLPNEFIFKQVEESLQSGNSVKIRLSGVSMLPMLKPKRDILVFAPLDINRIKIGDIVLFRYQGKHIAHRIISYKSGIYTLCGDAHYNQFEKVGLDDVIAILVAIKQDCGKTTQCNAMKWRFRSWLWRKGLPLRRYLMAIYRRL